MAFIDGITPASDQTVLVPSMDTHTTHPSSHPFVASLAGSCRTAQHVLIANMHTGNMHRSPQPYVALLDGSCPTALQLLNASMDTDTTHQSPKQFVLSLDGSCPPAAKVRLGSMDVDTPRRGPVPDARLQPHLDSPNGTADRGSRCLIASMDVDSPQGNTRVLIARMDSASTRSTIGVGTLHPPQDCPERSDVSSLVHFLP